MDWLEAGSTPFSKIRLLLLRWSAAFDVVIAEKVSAVNGLGHSLHRQRFPSLASYSIAEGVACGSNEFRHSAVSACNFYIHAFHDYFVQA